MAVPDEEPLLVSTPPVITMGQWPAAATTDNGEGDNSWQEWATSQSSCRPPYLEEAITTLEQRSGPTTVGNDVRNDIMAVITVGNGMGDMAAVTGSHGPGLLST